MKRHLLIIGIIFLFFISAVTPMTTGLDTETSEVDVELERMLDNLRFICTGPGGFNSVKYEHYKEQLLSMYSSESSKDDIVVEPEEKESTTFTEQPSLPIVSSGGPMDSPWPMKCHDNRHTGLSPYSTADNPCAEKWRFKTNNWIEGGSVIGNDGTIYFGDFDDYLYALSPDGTEKWKYKTGGWIWSTPAISEDGTIYIGSWDDYLHAINQDGTMKWKFPADDISSSPAIGEDGTIYFGVMGPGNNGRIYALNPNGTEKWYYDTGYWVVSDPAIADDGTLYIGSGDNYLYAIWPNGTLHWRFKTGDIVKSHPSIAEDGTICFDSFDGYLYALYPNGTMKWKSGGGSGCSSVAIGIDGTLYFGYHTFYALYPNNGTVKWSFGLENRHIGHASPAISAEGIIYIGVEIGENEGGEIIAVNPDGTERWQKKISTHGWCDSSPSIGEDGTIYIGSSFLGAEDYGHLHAFGVGELEADAHGPYYGLINQPIQFTGTSSGGYSPHSYFWDFGDTFTSEEQNPTHTYSNPDNYNVVLTVTDNESNTVTDTTYAWIQTTNTAPDQPDIDGPISGNTGTSYPYTFVSTDPEGLQVWYYIDWGDETNTGWIGPYNSGVIITKSHKWTNQGTFTIKAKAKDPYNDEGPWGELTVTMPRDKATNEMLLLRLLEQFPLLREVILRLIPR